MSIKAVPSPWFPGGCSRNGARNVFPCVNPWGFLQPGRASTETTSPYSSAQDSAAVLSGRVVSGDRDNPVGHCLSAWSIFQTFW